MSSNRYNRRNFVKLSTAAAVGGAAMMSGIGMPAVALAKNKTPLRTIRLGFVGLGERGSGHLKPALGIEGVEIPAICDIIPEKTDNARKWIEESGRPAPRLYDRGREDFRRMCENEELDAVICSTSPEWHAPVCLAAMRNNKHAVSEFPVVISSDEAWELVETYEKTGKWAAHGLEGFSELSLLNMVRKGLLGEVIHAEGGGIPGPGPDQPVNKILPALDINHGDRIDFLVSMSSGSGMQPDVASRYNATLMRTVKGKMITLYQIPDTLHPPDFYRLQGTRGVFMGDRNAKWIYIEGLSPVEHTWEPAGKYLAEYEHPLIRNYNPQPGKGESEAQVPMCWHRLVEAIRENRLPDWDVYDSVTGSAMIPVKNDSAANKSKPVDFPDFTGGKWQSRAPITLA